MSNEDSFNDSDEVFSLYSSKKVTDTFKAQLKKIAASNQNLTNGFSHTNNGDSNNKKEEEANLEIPANVKKRKVAATSKKPIDSTVEIEGTQNPAEINNYLEDSIEVITEFTPRRSTRQSERIRKRRGTCSLNYSEDHDLENLSVKRPSRSRRKGKKQQNKIIDEVTLDDSPQQTEQDDELNAEITVKVIWKSVHLKKFQIRKFQKLSFIFEQLAKEENISEDKIMLTFNNVRVTQSDTPDSLNLQVYHFLDGGVLSELSNLSQIPNEKDSECDSDSVILKFQDSNKKIIKLNLNKKDKLKIGMIKCSEQLEIPLEKIKFYLDGELVDPNETPTSLGLENEEIIDLKISS